MNKNQKLVQEAFLNNEEAVIKRLKTVYNKSLQDITQKTKALQDEINKLDVMVGMTEDEDEKAVLKSMQQSKIYQKQYQDAMKKQVSSILDNMQVEEFKTVSSYLQTCYEDGFIGTMYDLQGQGIPLCFPLDQEAMARAVQLDSKISEGLYTRLGEDVSMLKKKITAQISRGISTGMRFEQVAQQLANVTNIGFNNAVRIARTEGHRIQVQSGMDACYKAKEKGADVVKQWDSTLDDTTRESHQQVDGEIRELDEPFSNGLMFPGDPSGGAAEVINCRCALLQRARWALDEDELQTLQDRAAFYGLDKTANFEEYKQKYLNMAEAEKTAEAVKPKKEYLTEKKLKQNIDDADAELQKLEKEFENESGGWSYKEADKAIATFESAAAHEKNGGIWTETTKSLKSLKQQMDDITIQKADWEEKLNKKLVVKETKKLKKEEILLKEQLDNYDIKTYSNIWKDDVTTADWGTKQGSIQAKKNYFESKLNMTSDPDEIKKWQGLLDDLDDFDKNGAEYYKLQTALNKNKADLTKLQKNGKILNQNNSDAFTQDRKDAAYWFTDKNGSVKGADGVLRDKSGEVWRSATELEKDSIYEYTRSYHKYNEPLRGFEYGTNKFLGVGNVDLDEIGTKYGGFKRGQIHKEIDAITSIIDKNSYDFDIWVQRGCGRSGMDKFFGIDANDFNLPEADLAAKLVGTTPTEFAFMSTGVAKGKGLNTSGGITMNIYAPSGTKMMYIEPISAFGHGSGRSWDGVSPQQYFGHEAEMLMQRGTKFRVTKVQKSGGTIYVDMEVIEQGVF